MVRPRSLGLHLPVVRTDVVHEEEKHASEDVHQEPQERLVPPFAIDDERRDDVRPQKEEGGDVEKDDEQTTKKVLELPTDGLHVPSIESKVELAYSNVLTMSFWTTLPRPILVLAPLANVTDAAFRRIIAKYSRHVRKDGTLGGPDVFWTEFVSADGLIRANEEGRKKLLADLIYTDAERPIVAQLFTSDPTHMEQAAKLCRELGFDGIDINMGCPDRSVERQGAGAALIKDRARAVEVFRAAKQGAQGLPVSVKTRIGYHKNELESWVPALLNERPAALTIHARTRKEMSKVPARWEHVREAVAMRNELQEGLPARERTLILGNGDVTGLQDAEAKAEESGADGVMIGRAIFGNPWLFDGTKGNISIEERLRVMVEHTRHFEELLPFKSFSIKKKHFKSYVGDFPGARELRMQLMEAESGDEVEALVRAWIASHNA